MMFFTTKPAMRLRSFLTFMVEVFFEDVDSVSYINAPFLESWYNEICVKHQRELGDVTVVFCSDEYLLSMNQQHLNHDFYTDIITFEYNHENCVSGDLFISLDRVKDNSIQLSTDFVDELHRVCVHGLLHLLGFKDKSKDDEKAMRILEDQMLSLRMFHVEHLKS